MSDSAGEARISLCVYAVASRNEVVGLADGILRVKVSAPPVRGRANQELVAYLARLLGVGRDGVSIVRGSTSRNKVVAVVGVSQDEALNRLLS